LDVDGLFDFISGLTLFFGLFVGAGLIGGFLAGAELVDASFDVEQLLLTGEERVRRAGNMHFDDRVFVAIIPLGGLVGSDGGARQNTGTIIKILEDDEAVVIGM